VRVATAGDRWAGIRVARAGPVAYAVVGVGAAGFLLSLLLRRPGEFLPLFDVDLNLAVEFAASVLCLVGAARLPNGRVAGLLLGSGLLLWTVGDLLFSVASPAGAPVPSLADGFFLAFYPLAYLSLALTLHGDARGLLVGSWSDGLISALGCLTLVVGLGARIILQPGSGSWAAVAVTLAYPIGDLLLLSLVVAVLAMIPPWEVRRHLSWLALLAGCSVFAVSDTWYLVQEARGSYLQGTAMDAGWPLALILLSGSAWLPSRSEAVRTAVPGAGRLALPVAAGAIGVGVLVYGTQRPLGGVEVVLASVTLVTALIRSGTSLHRLASLDSERQLRIQAEQSRSRLEAREADNRALAERLAGLLDAAPVGIIETDAGGRVRRWNRAAERIYGWSEREVLAGPDPNPALPSAPGGCVHHVRKDGGGVEVEVSLSELAGPGTTGALKVVTDVTDRNRMELELRHAQKLESVGRLAEGLAHELNTPIQFVTDSVRFLQEAMDAVQRLNEAAALAVVPADPAELARLRGLVEEADLDFLAEEGPQAAQHALEGMERIAAIVRAIQVFGRPGESGARSIDLNEAVAAVLTVGGPTIGPVADLVTDFGDLPPVCCSPGDINQVLLDVVANAVDAMDSVRAQKGRGRLEVRTFVDGDSAVIEIADTGPGIPDRIADRVFDPFFTTKPVGQGIGQGLSVARTVVVQGHRGAIDFQSRPGHGTTFAIRLPIG
jgi:signal transduction histidine kinase